MKRIANIFLTVFFLLTIFLIPIQAIWGPHQEVSFYEQRALSPIPEISLESLWSGQFFSELEEAVCDHIPHRDFILKMYVREGMAIRKTTINKIVINSDVLLDYHGFSRWGLDYLADEAKSTAEDYDILNQEIQKYGGYFCYLGLPLQSTYFSSHYPDTLDSRKWHTDAIRDNFMKAMEEHSVPFINLYEQYSDVGFPQEFYYKTDHHFTMEGAFFAYSALMQRIKNDTGLDFSILAKEDFNWTSLPNPFLEQFSK